MDPRELLPDFELGLALFGDLLQEDPRLGRELVERQSTFGHAPAEADATERLHHAARTLEWFLFEAEGTAAIPAESLLDAWREATAGRLAFPAELYLQSTTGVFAVEGLGEDGTAAVRELAGLTPLRLVPSESLGTLRVGDLLVGRLFPLGAGLHAGTPALALVRSTELRQALERDLARLREGRSHAVLHLSQLELERMFWPGGGDAGAVSVGDQDEGADGGGADPVLRLEEFLRAGGLAASTISDWKRVLSRAPFDPRRLVTGVDDVVGALLEQVAFGTELDLEEARAHLLEAWPRLAARGVQRADSGGLRAGQVQAATTAEEVQASLEEFDRDRAAGLGVEASFDALERRLGLDDEDEDDGAGAPDFPGVVGAMVEEYLWELELERGPDARRGQEGLRLFAAALAPVGVFENVGPRDVLGFLTFRVCEGGAVREPEEARDLVLSMEGFGRWAEAAQGVELVDAELGEALVALREDLPRVVSANRELVEEAAPEDELFEFLGAGLSGGARIRDAAELEREVDADAAVWGQLRPGDLFRGHTLASGRFRIGRCYPPQARRLRQGSA